MTELFQIIANNWIAIVLLFAGLGLVAVEMFSPGFGVPGIAGIICLIIGVVLASNSLLDALLLVIGIMLILGLLLLLAVHSAKKGRISRSPLVLKESMDREKGFSSADAHLGSLLGKSGRTITVLRPAGIALIGDHRVDVVAEGTFLGKDVDIEVCHVEGNKVVVRPAAPSAQTASVEPSQEDAAQDEEG